MHFLAQRVWRWAQHTKCIETLKTYIHTHAYVMCFPSKRIKATLQTSTDESDSSNRRLLEEEAAALLAAGADGAALPELPPSFGSGCRTQRASQGDVVSPLECCGGGVSANTTSAYTHDFGIRGTSQTCT